MTDTPAKVALTVMCDPDAGSPCVELVPGGKPYFTIGDDATVFASLTDKRSMRKLRDLLTEVLDGVHTERG